MDSKNLRILAEYLKTKKKETQLNLPKIVNDAIDVLPNTVPKKMKLFMAIHELSTFVSNLGKTIRLNKRTKVTLSTYSIMFSGSGTSKDASINTIRNCLDTAYRKLKSEMEKMVIKDAKRKCIETTGSDKKWTEFYIPMTRSLFPSISTEEGAIAQMDRLQKTPLGAFSMTVSELSTDLKTNKWLIQLLKQLAIGYDLGKIPSKLVKTDDLQVNDIDALNMNIMMFSSIHTLLKDKAVKNAFIELFINQYARRTIFFMNTEDEFEKEFDSVEDLLKYELSSTIKADIAADNLEKRSLHILKIGKNSGDEISIKSGGNLQEPSSYDALEIYTLYKKYCSLLSKSISNKFEMQKIAVKHLYWKALKLAGIFAILRGRDEITKEDYIQAILVVEEFVEDLKMFQIEADKEPYELLVDFCIANAENGKLKITKHTLVKEGFIQSSISDKKLEEMLDLCTTYDKNGTYTYNKGYVIYKYLGDVDTSVEVSKEVILDKPKALPIKDTETSTSSSTKDVEKQPVFISDVKESNKETKVIISLKHFIDKDGNEFKFDDSQDGKEFRKAHSKDGFKNYKVPFNYYERVVNRLTAFSPYHYKDGIRTLDNVKDPSNVLVLDVDKTKISMYEMHNILIDYAHIVSTSSDINNKFKYRIVLLLDRPIKLNPRQWKKFYESVGNMLGIDIDKNINKASMFFGYPDAEVLTNYNGYKLETKLHLIKAQSVTVEEKKVKPCKNTYELDRIFDEREELFSFAYEATKRRSIKLYGAMRLACDYGFTKQMVRELLEDINYSMLKPKGMKYIEATILSQVDKFLINK